MLYSHVMPKERPGAGGSGNSIELFAKFYGETVEASFLRAGHFQITVITPSSSLIIRARHAVLDHFTLKSDHKLNSPSKLNAITV